MTAVPLYHDQFIEAGRAVLHHGQLRVDIWRYPSGVEALQITNTKGHVTVLPFMGQILWDARFAGLDLTMHSQFDMPRPAPTIIGTYGCLGFHSGLLANGVPGQGDSHPVHGEFPTCAMTQAMLFTGEDVRGRWVELWGRRNHVEGFGPHYDAEPTVRLYETETMIDWGMRVHNRSAFPMPLQYMAHLNPAFLPGATIHQPAPSRPTARRSAAPCPPMSWRTRAIWPSSTNWPPIRARCGCWTATAMTPNRSSISATPAQMPKAGPI